MPRLRRLGRHPERQHHAVDLTALIEGCVERARIADGCVPVWHVLFVRTGTRSEWW